MGRGALIVVGGLLLTPAVARAAAGLSDAAATQACWARAPYALIKCQSEGGRYPARLVRARPVTPDEDSYWSLLPARYDGIVPLGTVVDDIDRVAIAPRFLVARDRSGGYWVVALDEPQREPSRSPSVAAANESLARAGVAAVGEDQFVPFEEVYRASRPPYSVAAPLVLIGAVAVGCVLLFVVWRRR